jgi:hypothetical protein
MMKGVWTSLATAAGLLGRNVAAQSYNSIPDIEVFGQHFFYTNNGTQLYAPRSLL